MNLVLSVIYLALHVVYLALLGRLVLDWIQMFARHWRPKGIALLVATGVYTVTDPPMKFLRKTVPPLRLGGMSLDLGFLILVFVISIIQSMIGGLLWRM